MALRLLRGRPHAPSARRRTPRGGRVLRRPARRRPIRRGRCSSWRPTRGARTTTSAARTSTARSTCRRARSCRSGARSPAASCAASTARARASPSSTRPTRRCSAHVTLMLEEGYSSWFGSAGWSGWEGPFAAWAEAAGYGLDYAANADLADHPELLDGRRLVLSVGHDEYWTLGMRDAVETFARGGGNVAFLSGNTACWQVRIEDDGQTLVGYKEAFRDDPVLGTDRQAQLTTLWSDTLLGRPENAMTGVQLHARRLPPHRPQRRPRRRRLHGAAPRALGVRRHRRRPTATSSAPTPSRSATSATAATSRSATACRSRPAATARRPTSRSSASRRPSTSTATTRCAPVHEGDLSEVEHFASRVLGGHDPDEVAPPRHGHAVMGVHQSRRHRLHRRHHRVGLGLREPRPDHRADHPQPPRPAHRTATGPDADVDVRRGRRLMRRSRGAPRSVRRRLPVHRAGEPAAEGGVPARRRHRRRGGPAVGAARLRPRRRAAASCGPTGSTSRPSTAG